MIRSKQIRGFSLVELLIAMLLSGMLAVILYSLFNTTSESLGEVSNLSDAQERIRFAMERLRTDAKGAGSQATPDSAVDVWQQPPLLAGRVLGVSGYSNWQDQPPPAALAAANPNVSFDGFIVMGAFDYPVSFEVRGLTGDLADTDGQIAEHVRGLFKLYQIDPFSFSAANPPNYPGTTGFLERQWSTRLLRLMDRQGYFQFTTLDTQGTLAMLGGIPRTMSFGFANPPVPKAAGAEFGIDVNPEGDFAYDSALIDAYWYHVEPNPIDPTNMQLVRERLCAPLVMTGLLDSSSFDPAGALGSACPGGVDEVTIITDHVADFQVWFDCTTPASLTGAVVGAAWDDDWLKPETTTSCLGAAAYAPGDARVMHLRLSVYAPLERKDLLNFQFEDSTGLIGAAALGATPNVRLRTFDSVPTLLGAAPVVSMQSSVELTNYVYRNTVSTP
jgi:prepilin-type N-terminal cleavage/methylation domain-containing protein